MKTFKLENDFLMCELIDLGATITSLKLKGHNHNLITAYQQLDNYQNNTNYYLGATVAPSAGRIAYGKFELEGKDYQLDINSDPHHLHGGKHSLTTQVCEAQQFSDRVVFKKLVDHRIDGYPGLVEYEIVYQLVDNSLIVRLKATPSTTMPLNMTNHMYFNLDGSENVLDHNFRIDSKKVVSLDKSGAPSNQLIDVSETVFDFREEKTLNQLLNGHPQFEISRLLDHAYVFDKEKKAVLRGQEITLELETSASSLVCYTANFFDEGFVDDTGRLAPNHLSIALEPQEIPNAVNTKLVKNPFYTPLRPFESVTRYTFTPNSSSERKDW